MKDYRNIESSWASRDLESRRRGLWQGWVNRRFAKRLFSMLVVVCLLSNTLGLVVDDINAAQTRLASAEILEINPEHPIFARLITLFSESPEQLKNYAELLYSQALLIEGLPIDDPVAFSNAVCELMAR